MADDRAREAGLPDMQWPLRVISQDTVNMTELGSDGGVLTDRAKLADSLVGTFVMTAGDTMTGPLIVSAATTVNGGVLIVERDGTTGSAIIGLNNYSDTTNAAISFRRTRGTKAAQAPLLVNDTVGRIIFNTINESGAAQGGGFIMSYVSQAPTTAGIGTTVTLSSVGLVNGVATNFSANLGHNGVFTCAKGAFELIDIANIMSFNGICKFTNAISVTQTEATPDSGLFVDRKVSGIGCTVHVTGTASATRDIAYYGLLPAGSAAATYGVWIDSTGSGTIQNIGLYVHNLPAAANNYVLYSRSPAQSHLAGNLGLNFLTPTHQLEVGGTTMLRGTCEITGNITASGTAHSFAAGSIGSPAVIGNTPRTIAATGSAGSAGQMVWDDNFLYLRTTAGWKKVALTAI